MRTFALVLAVVLTGCGGAVEKDDVSPSGGAGGNGSGGTGGSGGTAGSGGTGGIDQPPVCCTDASDCPELGGPQLKNMSCVSGLCKPPPPDGQCWQDENCEFGMCVGAVVCGCGYDFTGCDSEMPGWCAYPDPPPQPACCSADMECGDETYVPCVNGQCKQPVQGHCWKDSECPGGQTCIGASVCPCGDCPTCGVCNEDQPGKCA